MAQTGSTWKLCFNGKEIIKGNVEQADELKTIDASAILKHPTKNFTIYYNQADVTTGWNRTFFINDENDQVLHTITMTSQSGSVSFPATYLSKSASSKKPVFLYTTSLPKDKKKAAVVRVRRILLSKIEWK